MEASWSCGLEVIRVYLWKLSRISDCKSSKGLGVQGPGHRKLQGLVLQRFDFEAGCDFVWALVRGGLYLSYHNGDLE